MLISKSKKVRRGQISGFRTRIAIFTISRVKNLSTAGHVQIGDFEKKQKETWLILPVVICLSQSLNNSGIAKSPIWSTDCNFYHFPRKGNVQIGDFEKKQKETWLILPVVICLSQSLSNSGMAKAPIWSTDCNFYHFPCKEFINSRAMYKFQISRRNKRKPG